MASDIKMDATYNDHNLSFLYNNLYDYDDKFGVDEKGLLVKKTGWFAKSEEDKVASITLSIFRKILINIDDKTYSDDETYPLKSLKKTICMDSNNKEISIMDFVLHIDSSFSYRLRKGRYSDSIVKIGACHTSDIDEELDPYINKKKNDREIFGMKIHILARMITLGGTKLFKSGMEELYRDSKAANKYISFLTT